MEIKISNEQPFRILIKKGFSMDDLSIIDKLTSQDFVELQKWIFPSKC